MQISTKGQYALRFLLDVCQHQSLGPVPLKSVAVRQGISKKYLEHVVAMLGPAGILKITRGNAGGYQLAKPAASITLADVLRATEGGIAPVQEGNEAVPSRAEEQMAQAAWGGLAKVMADYLEGVSLQDLLDRYSPTIEYYI